jgi:uncharacterized repeat protein (TIGR03803 family)
LILSNNTLYGTAYEGGSSGLGTVFVVNTDGTGFTNLHAFEATYASPLTNSEGAKPDAGIREFFLREGGSRLQLLAA